MWSSLGVIFAVTTPINVMLAFGSTDVSSDVQSLGEQENGGTSSDLTIFNDGTFTKPQNLGIKMDIPLDGTWSLVDCTNNVTLYHHIDNENTMTDADLSVNLFQG